MNSFVDQGFKYLKTPTGRLYLAGGGDEKYAFNEIIYKDKTGKMKLVAKKSMRYQRIGHSMCSLGPEQIVVSGSAYQDKQKCELFN